MIYLVRIKGGKKLETNKIHNCDCMEGLKNLPDGSIDCCVTSPPYWGLRDYGVNGQIGLEETPEEYVDKLVLLFREVKRVLKKEGTLWLNLGDSYYGGGWKGSQTDLTGTKQNTNAGTLCGKNMQKDKKHEVIKSKDLVGIPWLVAFALRADGWYLRQDIIWHKPNPMPESVTDRCTKSHEYIFLLSKSPKYYFDNETIKEKANYAGHSRGVSKNISVDGITDFGGKTEYDDRNKRSVWTVNTKPFKESHFATFPEELITPCILAGSKENGVVLDPFMGAGTTALVSLKNNRQFIGFELNDEYCKLAEKRLEQNRVIWGQVGMADL